MKCDFPIYLIDLVKNTAEFFTKIDEISYCTQLALKTNSLINLYILDAKDKVFVIKDAKDLGRLRSFNLFAIFNPLKKIELTIEEINPVPLKFMSQITQAIEIYKEEYIYPNNV